MALVLSVVRLLRWWFTLRRHRHRGRLFPCVMSTRLRLMRRFLKPCVECGVPTRESRCGEHKLADRRPSTARRGSSSERSKRRSRTLRRDGFRCVACGVVDKTGRALEADHIVPLEVGGSHDLENMQTLCKPCHLLKTRGESDARHAR